MHWEGHEFIKELVCHFCRPEQCKPPWLGRLPVLATPGDRSILHLYQSYMSHTSLLLKSVCLSSVVWGCQI